MYKIKQSSRNITPYGGLNFIYSLLSEKGVGQYIDSQLGTRSYQAKYSYGDVLLSLFGNSMSNGEYVADLEHFKEQYSEQVFNNIPSPDTVEYVCQELKIGNKTELNQKKGKTIEHQINDHEKMNKTLVGLNVYTGLLRKGIGYTLDYDNVVVENEKQDSRKSYKKVNGYHPGFAFIGKLPVHIENHNGNTPAKYRQKEILTECFNHLEDKEIEIKNYRGDSASYQKEVVKLLEEKECDFFIRNSDSQSFSMACASKDVQWKKESINYQDVEVADIEYAAFGGKKSYRVVITRRMNKDKQLDLFTGTAYKYYGILTNNHTLSNRNVILFYDQRGNDSENGNKNLLNDFNLKRLPFMDMDTNTVYMLLMALCNVLFEFVKRVLVKNHVPGITLADRVKRVCYRYVSVCSTFVRHAGEQILTVFSPVQYKTLQLII